MRAAMTLLELLATVAILAVAVGVIATLSVRLSMPRDPRGFAAEAIADGLRGIRNGCEAQGATLDLNASGFAIGSQTGTTVSAGPAVRIQWFQDDRPCDVLILDGSGRSVDVEFTVTGEGATDRFQVSGLTGAVRRITAVALP